MGEESIGPILRKGSDSVALLECLATNVGSELSGSGAARLHAARLERVEDLKVV